MSSQMLLVATCLHDKGGLWEGYQSPRKERFAQIEQSHNKDTPIKFPTILHFFYIVKIKSKDTN